jgi:carboxypeptidase C (cathepsin A)
METFKRISPNPAWSSHRMNPLRTHLLALLLAATPPLALASAQTPKDEAHADIRKDVGEAEKKPDPRESKVPGEEAHNTPADKDKKADESKNKDKDRDKSAGKEKKDEKEAEKPVVTHGKVTIDGKEIAYTATAGKMLMKTDEGDPKAHVFFIAYTKNDPHTSNSFSRDPQGERDEPENDNNDKKHSHHDGDDNDNADDSNDEHHSSDLAKPNRRPITFCFNGGPGSASVWLHIGMLGPVRVKLDSDAKTLPPPHELTKNEYSLLDVTDLVFIDPVSTGFSRPVKGQDKRQFHGYDEDVRSVAQFIHDYTTKYSRWDSPKFLIGESYGGIRAAGLSGELQDRYRMYLNGIVLVSAVVDFQTLMAGGHNDIAYALFLPSYATTAWYRKALSDDMQKQSVQEVMKAAEKFAAGPYLRALTAGDSLDKDRRQEVVKQMAELTGLDEDYIEASNLRVPMYRFGKELLRKRGLIVGRFDSRYTGPALDRVGDSTEYDPSASAVFGTFTSALNDYLRTTLKVKEDRVYEILTDRVQPWDYSEFTNRFVDASPTLRSAMTENPYLHVFAACGYYDLATPEFAMKYTRDHLNLADELRGHFTMHFYEGGHMMYAHEPSLKKLRTDLVKFYGKTLEPLEESKHEK